MGIDILAAATLVVLSLCVLLTFVGLKIYSPRKGHGLCVVVDSNGNYLWRESIHVTANLNKK